MGATLLDLMADALPGSDLGGGARGVAEVLRGSRHHRTSPDAASVCRCLVEAAVREGEVRRDITIHLLSLRTMADWQLSAWGQEGTWLAQTASAASWSAPYVETGKSMAGTSIL